jgi:uracil-DNA glycosylase
MLVDKLIDGKFVIASTLRNNIHKKLKSNINIDLIIIYEGEFMTITPHELDFLCVEFSKNTYNNYQYGSYNLMYYNFVANTKKLIDDENMQKWELTALKRFHYTWYNPLRPFIQKEYREFINKPILIDREKYKVYPEHSNMLSVFNKTNVNYIRVVILGEDPYPAQDYATGIAFGSEKLPIPNSLKQIESAIRKDYPDDKGLLDYSLEYWLKQGVMLLNTSLSVIENQPNSHKEIWRKFITLVITLLGVKEKKIVFCLLGSEAKRYKEQLESAGNKVICVEHPAYAVKEKRDWIYDNMFQKVNQELSIKIKWLNN